MTETKLPKGISKELFKTSEEIILSGFENKVDPGTIKTVLIVEGKVPYNRVSSLYNLITKKNNLVVNVGDVKTAILKHMDTQEWFYDEDYDEILKNTKDIIANVVGATTQRALSVIKNVFKENDKTFPKKPSKPRGRIGIVNKIIINLFAHDPNATEQDIIDALKDHVKSEKNAKAYAKQYHKISYALANSLTVEELMEKITA
ncbi:MAG: hypothetical protein GY834_10650 [Bacteroidetes bacterium]|nr:hypothetical protein [Bacteroidota bacterium]